MPPTEPAVVVTGVGHRYGATAALIDVSLTVPAGGTVAVIGPDGVGKSTLLGLIAGVKKLQTGSVQVLGGDMASSAHRNSAAPRIAYMPQGLGRNLYPTLSVAENIDFFGRLFGLSAEERRQRVGRLLQATGLHPFPDRPAGKLSGGMKQKLSLCCSLVHDPDLLILDEPTTGVDPLSRRQFWSLIASIRADRPGMTVIVATAYMEEAALFDRLVAMDAGRILAAGTTAEVLAGVGAATPEEAYRALLDPAGGSHAALVMPPRREVDGPPAIEAENLTCRFGSFTAVDHVSFSIGRGEIFGFLGSNGCGKTTTMKMLAGLLPASSGSAALLGRPVTAGGIETRLRVGYMSQAFSLYEELSVRDNLLLHARLYRIPEAEVATRIERALDGFGLRDAADTEPASLPLGIRQRLQLAAACLHDPEVLILDEPTSGVDPAARDMFWQLLGGLSRDRAVTIFVSTHFMNEAERCDRISLMHAGRVLAVGTPAELARGHAGLEDAFIAQLEAAGGGDPGTAPPAADAPRTAGADTESDSGAGRRRAEANPESFIVSAGRVWAFARREMVEVLRDRIRLAFALLGPLLLLVTLGYGISFDVEDLSYAVFDRDQSLESRRLVEEFAGSRYFSERSPILTDAEIDRRLRSGELKLVISIPPGFGRDLLSGHGPELAVFLDGAMPFRAETARGYVQGIALQYANRLLTTEASVPVQSAPTPKVEPRFRYNQDFRSAAAILPGCIMVLMILIPSMLTAVGVVREREIGSISNLYASPASVGEFLLGKQMPYIVIGFTSFLSLVLLADLLFDVPVRGSLPALLLGGLLYVGAATGLGLVVSTFARTQVAAMAAAAILTTVPSINFSGFLYPAATVEGAGHWIGLGFPALWFQNVSLGTFAKIRPFEAFYLDFFVLFGFCAGFLIVASLMLAKQER
ncbi:ribosome-associated ATPase/putative transporter RbbA [Rhodospirillum centenum]|uniref:ABC transporter, ATP-binding protein n=1 Tax=Rhodospirillum centenum (strain ATCC 51521 / SW) TaxID=414684 RepID=B6IXP6_RHOCS|nr:ribosome-associated ATPase/putative transporter RbbA [Rhodospirillum centenum]ACJ01070.1 ABC transporter, ATP-binding protein [Rhodospirillum centenum SW]